MGISSENFFNILKDGSSTLKENLDSFKDVAEAEAKLSDQSEELRKETIKLKNEFNTLALEVMPPVIAALRGFEGVLGSDETKENIKSFISGIGTVAHWFDVLGKTIGWVVARLSGNANDDYKAEHGDAPSKSYKDLKEISDKRKIDIANARRISGTSSESTKSSESAITSSKGNSKSIVGKLVAMGWTPEQAAGIAGNLQHESGGFNPGATGDNGSAYGLAQWHPDRQSEFKKFTGKDIRGSSMDDQLKFVNYELTKGNEEAAGDKIRATKTSEEAALATRRYYERANVALAHDDMRIKNAKNLLSGYQSSNASSAGNLPLAFKPQQSSTQNNSSSSSEAHINTININTQATDANGISKDIHGAMTRNFNFGPQNANTGLT